MPLQQPICELHQDIGQQYGKIASKYSKGRKEYPEQIFSFLKSYVSKDRPILDIGCGNGLATRQLHAAGLCNCIGLDPDERMLKEAMRLSPPIAYEQGDASHLPFGDAQFFCVTSFASFHWFCTPESIREIKRVLQKGGYFLVVNREDLSSFRKDFDALLEKETKQKMVVPKKEYRPKEMLQKYGFTLENESHIFAYDTYTFDDALAFCETLRSWSSLSEKQQKTLFPQVQDFIEQKMKNGVFVRENEVRYLLFKLAS